MREIAILSEDFDIFFNQFLKNVKEENIPIQYFNSQKKLTIEMLKKDKSGKLMPFSKNDLRILYYVADNKSIEELRREIKEGKINFLKEIIKTKSKLGILSSEDIVKILKLRHYLYKNIFGKESILNKTVIEKLQKELEIYRKRIKIKKTYDILETDFSDMNLQIFIKILKELDLESKEDLSTEVNIEYVENPENKIEWKRKVFNFLRKNKDNRNDNLDLYYFCQKRWTRNEVEQVLKQFFLQVAIDTLKSSLKIKLIEIYKEIEERSETFKYTTVRDYLGSKSFISSVEVRKNLFIFITYLEWKVLNKLRSVKIENRKDLEYILEQVKDFKNYLESYHIFEINKFRLENEGDFPIPEPLEEIQCIILDAIPEIVNKLPTDYFFIKDKKIYLYVSNFRKESNSAQFAIEPYEEKKIKLYRMNTFSNPEWVMLKTSDIKEKKIGYSAFKDYKEIEFKVIENY
ncbi:hypothetical protein [uncultured Cetobacterium sp.]|uniref:hypothetical protein n=1 Tax=uncultured Cetobacterium sp. TaxID=527638 RepID=UPI00260CBA11|nr:hypothetical protein [uncultured Cetobacterium sp.]